MELWDIWVFEVKYLKDKWFWLTHHLHITSTYHSVQDIDVQLYFASLKINKEHELKEDFLKSWLFVVFVVTAFYASDQYFLVFVQHLNDCNEEKIVARFFLKFLAEICKLLKCFWLYNQDCCLILQRPGCVKVNSWSCENLVTIFLLCIINDQAICLIGVF